MKKWLLGLSLLCMAQPALAETLSFANGSSTADVQWSQGPRNLEESTLLLSWKNAAGELSAAPGIFKVVPFMPAMGHGSSPTKLEPIASGTYRVSKIFFTMPGAWEIRVQVKFPGGQEETQSFPLQITGPAHSHHGLSGVLGGEPLPAPAPGTLAASKALAAICADGVTPHPRKQGYWHLDRPRFALSDTALYATMNLSPTDKGSYAVVKVDRANPESFTELARFKDPVRDLEIHDGKAWALFAKSVVALDADTGVEALNIPTTLDLLSNEEETAQAFAWIGNRLVIAHGTRGMVAYDEKAAGITMAHDLSLNANGQQSKAIDVATVNGNQVAFAVENVTVSNKAPFPFNGIVLMNLNGGSQAIERYAYDRKTSGSLSVARVAAVDGQLLINNWGILHQVNIEEMRRQGAITARWKPIHFETAGGRQAGELLGDFIVENGNVAACAQTQYQDGATRRVIHEGVVYSQPLAEILK
ncbi:MAG: hypothetical protein EOP11_07140 [Proteobacteria bacterium]|nr:MAG: hypothetical protein EOP11_07140 [Pseudomonadota bacterium]